MVESTEQVSGFTCRSEELRVISRLSPAVAEHPRPTHQRLHLQLLRRARLAPCECAGNHGETEQKKVRLHGRVPEKSCHWPTSVRAASCACTPGRAPSSKMAQRRRTLMCSSTVAISSSGPWTLSQHLGPASNIPLTSHGGSDTPRRR